VPGRSADWRTWAWASLRPARLVVPSEEHRFADAEAVGLEPTSGWSRHLFSRQAPDPAGWLPSTIPDFPRPCSSGGWNRTSGLHVQSVALLPAATAPESPHPRIREGGFEPPPPDSKSGSLPVSRFPRASCGNRTRLSGVGSPCLAARPRTLEQWSVLSRPSSARAHTDQRGR
jgi:hypothetical protein